MSDRTLWILIGISAIAGVISAVSFMVLTAQALQLAFGK